MQQHNLIKAAHRCERRACRRAMVLIARDGTDGYRWRCPRRQCRSTKSIRDGSLFQQSRLSLKLLLALIYCWCVGMRLTTVCIVLGLSEPTVVDWFNFLREECTYTLLQAPIILGGEGSIVEIDESLMVKRKYQRGDIRVQHNQWVFGIYDRRRHVGFIQFVHERTAQVLLPIIDAHVTPSSTIYSDGWAAYRHLGHHGYQHAVVIHDNNFVDPVTGVHINGVEAYWSRAKQKLKAVYGSQLHMIPSYLDEFMWRERYGQHTAASYAYMLEHIAEHYM